jgi:hypothetical protein
MWRKKIVVPDEFDIEVEKFNKLENILVMMKKKI